MSLTREEIDSLKNLSNEAYLYESIRLPLLRNTPCPDGEHEYDSRHHRLRGFSGHDYFVNYCKKCGRDKPNFKV